MTATLDAYERYLRVANYRPDTVYARRRVLWRLSRTHPDLTAVTHDDLMSWLDELDVIPGTRATYVAAFRSFYRWAHSMGLTSEDPTVFVPRPKVPRGLPRPMSDQALRDGIQHGPDRVRLALMLAAYAGLRAGEIGRLRGEHVTDALVRVENGKGGDSGTVPLHPVLAEELAVWPQVGPVFPLLRGRGHAAGYVVSAAVNSWLRGRGHPDTLHMARHWFGTRAYGVSADLRAVQELMRHRSVVSTQIYTALVPSRGGAIVSQLPDVA